MRSPFGLRYELDQPARFFIARIQGPFGRIRAISQQHSGIVSRETLLELLLRQTSHARKVETNLAALLTEHCDGPTVPVRRNEEV
jgi:hypothetical protein